MPDAVADNQGSITAPTATTDVGGVGTNPQTGSTGDWFSQIPAELQSEKSLQAFKGKGVADLVKSHVEAQKLIGGSIRLPKPEATPEERAKFEGDIFNKLGRPENAAGYKYEKLKVPEGVQWSDEHEGKFKEVAHSLGLTNNQLSGVMKWYGEYLNQASPAPDHAALQQAGREALLKEFGSETIVNQKLALAQRLLVAHGDKALVDLVEQSGIGNDPAFIKLMAKFGSQAAEKGIINGEVKGAMNVDQIGQEIAALRGDPKSAYNDEKNPGHDAAVQRMNELYRMRSAFKG